MWGLDDIVELLECDEQVEVIRCGTDTPADVCYIDGRPRQSRPAYRATVTATLQPAGGRDLMLLPEGFRDRDSLSMWQAHRTAAQEVLRVQVQDIVLYCGRGYQVQSSQDWGSFTKAMLVGIDLGSYAGVLEAATAPEVYPLAAEAIALSDAAGALDTIAIGDRMGNYLYAGSGMPAASLGGVGDLYYDKASGLTVGPKALDGWPELQVASLLFHGNGPPSAAIVAQARAIDYYVDDDTAQLYSFTADTTKPNTLTTLPAGPIN